MKFYVALVMLLLVLLIVIATAVPALAQVGYPGPGEGYPGPPTATPSPMPTATANPAPTATAVFIPPAPTIAPGEEIPTSVGVYSNYVTSSNGTSWVLILLVCAGLTTLLLIERSRRKQLTHT